jgi:hypothetical protein
MGLRERFFDIILSVYLFNEERGFTYLDDLAEAFSRKFPHEQLMLASIRKHAADERHHYSLFRGYFVQSGRAPFAVTKRYGYCDQMVQLVFGKSLEALDPRDVIASDQTFFRLCRLIMITELRGMQQVNLLLGNFLVRRRPDLVSIFTVVKRDEPSHCYPYQAWLRRHGEHEPRLRERAADAVTHYSLAFLKLPALFLNPFLARVPLSGKMSVAALAGSGPSRV